MATGIKTKTINLKSKHYCRVSFNNTGSILFATSNIKGNLDIIDVENGIILQSIPNVSGPVAVLSDNSTLIFFDRDSAYTYDYINDEIIKSNLKTKGKVRDILIINNEKKVVALDSSGQINIGKIVRYKDKVNVYNISSRLMAHNDKFKPIFTVSTSKNKILTISKGGVIYEVDPTNLQDNKRILNLNWSRVDGFESLGNNRYVMSGYGRREKSNLVYIFDYNKNSLENITRNSKKRSYILVNKELGYLFNVTYKNITNSKITGLKGVSVINEQNIAKLNLNANKYINKSSRLGKSSKYTVSAIGVYEGKYPQGVKHSFRFHPSGHVKVHLGKFATPFILVLSSCEPVDWNLNNRTGKKIDKILLSGPASSKIIYRRASEIIRVKKTCAYKRNSKSFNKLSGEVQTITGSPLTSFQGMYEGESFNIGEVSKNMSPNFYRWKDSDGVTHFGDKPK